MVSKIILILCIPHMTNHRFLKADQDSGKFNLMMFDIASTHPAWITEQRHRAFGKCYTIYPDEKSR